MSNTVSRGNMELPKTRLQIERKQGRAAISQHVHAPVSLVRKISVTLSYMHLIIRCVPMPTCSNYTDYLETM